MEPVEAPEPAPATRAAVPVATTAAIRREDCALTLVAAEDAVADLSQATVAAAVFALARQMRPAEFTVGIQALRNRLLHLHAGLRESQDSFAMPAAGDCAIAAAHVTEGKISVLRIGVASAWRWRRGHLQSLFTLGSAMAAAADTSFGDDLDDLLFSAQPSLDPGIGTSGTPAWDETVCAVQPGDRLLLAASPRLVNLSPDLLMRGLGMRTREEAVARLAAAADLGSNPLAWPLSVIQVGP